jgi:trk system potassium uptake protein TrkA
MIGVGSFGYHLLTQLAQSDFFVAAIDTDAARVEMVKTIVQKPLIGDASSKETLKEIGVSSYDYVVVSVGDRLDTSILTCLHLKELGAKNIIVKAAHDDHVRLMDMLNVQRVIFPEREAAHQLAHTLADLNVLRSIAIEPGISLVEIAVPSDFEGKALSDLLLPSRFGVQVVLIRQLIPEATILPRADFIIKASDTLVIIGTDDAIHKLQQMTT